MSDHDAAPDPMDKAYAQAEAILHDESARAARRARVLAAVAREPAPPPAISAPAIRRSAWGRGGWLVAASVAGLSVLLATQVHLPASTQPPPAPPTPAARAATAPEVAAPPPPAANEPSQTPKPAPRTIAVAPRAVTSASRDPSPVPPPPAPSAGLSELVVTAERRAQAPATISRLRPSGGPRDEAVDAEDSARSVVKPTPSPGFAVLPAPAPSSEVGPVAGAPPAQAARLRVAAAAGRTAELAALLAKGIPVDAPDADGETALMKAVHANHPAAAALLRRHGAGLDRKNNAGVSARDMATSIGDPELNRALGLP